jgi:hypothetical protein
MRKISDSAIMVLFLLTGCGVGNLIPNGGFEKGSQEDFAKSYDQSWIYYGIAGNPEGKIVEDEKKSGQRSYRFSLGKESRAFLHSKPFRVEPSSPYRVSGWVKIENATSSSVFLRIFWFKDKVGIPAVQGNSSYEDTEKLGGSSDWQKLETIVVTPSDCNLAYLRLESNSGNLEEGGDKLFYQSQDPVTVWFDDIDVKRVSEETSEQ